MHIILVLFVYQFITNHKNRVKNIFEAEFDIGEIMKYIIDDTYLEKELTRQFWSNSGRQLS